MLFVRFYVTLFCLCARSNESPWPPGHDFCPVFQCLKPGNPKSEVSFFFLKLIRGSQCGYLIMLLQFLKECLNVMFARHGCNWWKLMWNKCLSNYERIHQIQVLNKGILGLTIDQDLWVSFPRTTHIVYNLFSCFILTKFSPDCDVAVA
jgi:hypothetical protein